MPVKIILGAQWGDEGKGKLVDVLSSEAEYVIRYQGGANAGHTVYFDGNKYVLHLLPTGVLRPDVKCLLGNGMVIDPEALLEEFELLNSCNIDYKDRIFISDRAHVIFPFHKVLDRISEETLDNNKIGTTGRGIGPAYVDKYNRTGIRVADLFDDNTLKRRLENSTDLYNKILVDQYSQKPLSFSDIYNRIIEIALVLEPFVSDVSKIIYDSINSGKSILMEGAQGALLDVDFGTYPYVTSSNPTSGGAINGCGISPIAIDEIIGVMKAYVTRVGEGPFPSEELNSTGEKLRAEGNEFGATTGRPRRCGWFDAVAAKYSVRINGLTSIAITKLDVLDAFDEIKICTAYECNGSILKEFPASLEELNLCKPVYETYSGWNTKISGVTAFKDLPENTQKFIKAIEKYCNVPAKYISVGVDRKQIIQQNV